MFNIKLCSIICINQFSACSAAATTQRIDQFNSIPISAMLPS